ncbi:MAG: ATP-binding cassette domain-containing protein [Desulfuromonadales bacterium]|nr:ATP-binding cassette domain-containing protein [Desulfuromonadales bacterium]
MNPRTMEAVFSLQNIELSRGDTFTLRVERLEVLSRGIYALSGPNGAGKSTLLGVMAMLMLPDSGVLRFAGRLVSRRSSERKELRQQITLVEQTPYMFAGSVFQNLAFCLRLRGIRGDEQRRLIVQALEDVGLGGFEGRNVRELSRGETQRVALARALVLRPKVLLLDEPTVNIDDKRVSAFEALLIKLSQQGMTIVFSTHDPDQPGRLGAEVIRLREGQVEDAAERGLSPA